MGSRSEKTLAVNLSPVVSKARGPNYRRTESYHYLVPLLNVVSLHNAIMKGILCSAVRRIQKKRLNQTEAGESGKGIVEEQNPSPSSSGEGKEVVRNASSNRSSCV